MKIESTEGRAIDVKHKDKGEIVLEISLGWDENSLTFDTDSATKLVNNILNAIELSQSVKTKSELDKYAYSLFTRKVIIVPSHLAGQVIAYAKSIYQIEAEDCGKDESGENSAIMRLTINSKDY